jgi:hypothetical protein
MPDIKKAYLFDLDGTLCCTKQRSHFVEGDQKDWDSFNRSCIHDAPKPSLKLMMDLHQSGFNILINSGRSEIFFKETKTWFKIQGVRVELANDSLVQFSKDFIQIRMRRSGDKRPDTLVKERMLRDLMWNEVEIILAFDDRQCIVDLYRQLGIPTAQVDVSPDGG